MGVIRCDQGEWKRIGMIESLEKVSDPQLGSNSIKSSHQKILARLVRKLHGARGYGMVWVKFLYPNWMVNIG